MLENDCPICVNPTCAKLREENAKLHEALRAKDEVYTNMHRE